eukprot:gene1478-32862_t
MRSTYCTLMAAEVWGTQTLVAEQQLGPPNEDASPATVAAARPTWSSLWLRDFVPLGMAGDNKQWEQANLIWLADHPQHQCQYGGWGTTSSRSCSAGTTSSSCGRLGTIITCFVGWGATIHRHVLVAGDQIISARSCWGPLITVSVELRDHLNSSGCLGRWGTSITSACTAGDHIIKCLDGLRDTYQVLVVLGTTSSSACSAGDHIIKALPEKKSEVMHLMSSFDRTLFRTVGPLLPLAVLALRWLALDLPTVFVRAAGGDPKGVQDRPSTDTTTTLGPVYARATMISSCLLVYCIVALCRIALYSLHLALQHSSASGDLNHVAAAWMSDHLVLGASVVACLQVEIVCALSDVVKVEIVRAFSDVIKLSVSILLGATLFQAPVVPWLKENVSDRPWAQAHRAAFHVH